MFFNRPFLRYRGHLLRGVLLFSERQYGVVRRQMPEKLYCEAAILKFCLISDYSLCCIALTEYMLCILWIAHDFIALKIKFL
jgi:hypothetical protein